MTDAYYKKICQKKNLELALLRISTSQNISYKNYYRNALVAYNIAKDNNLSALSERLKNKGYHFSEGTKIFIPKKTGLHRPITLLYLDDLIVYQAIINVISKKFAARRKNLERKIVFSNILTSKESDTGFLFEKWQTGYNLYINKIEKYFNNGHFWVAHFDLAAFYDTISHTKLLSLISKQSYKDTKNILGDALKKWSTLEKDKLTHGIPQGPISSAYLAELYLLPMDEFMKRKKVKYIRYVDDIKIFGKTRHEVMENVLLLEKKCRELGLIPQVSKYVVQSASSISEAIGSPASQTIRINEQIFADSKKLGGKFKKLFETSQQDNYSSIKYILRRADKNQVIFDCIIDKLNQYPDLVDEICLFLQQYSDDISIGQTIYENALKTPSHDGYVEGQYWELLSWFKLTSRKYIDIACMRLKESSNKPAKKIGLYKFLASTENSLVLHWLIKEPLSIIQMIVGSKISKNCYENKKYKELVHLYFTRDNYAPAIICIKDLLFAGKADILEQLVINGDDETAVIGNTLGRSTDIDTIGSILKKMIKLPLSKKWKKLLGQEYKLANEILCGALYTQYLDRNSWVGYVDSFNNIVIRQFITYINDNYTIPAGKKTPKLNDSQGKSVDFGNLLIETNYISETYPKIIDPIREIHKRRNTTPTSHPYNSKTMEEAQNIESIEQKRFFKILLNSYKEILSLL